MYLWRRQATPQWWRAHQSALESRFGDKLALIAQPTRKRLQIQIALNSASRLRELVKIAGGRIEKLPRDWLQRFQRQHKPKPIRIKDRQLIIPAGAAFGTGEHATTAMSLKFLERVFRRWGAHAPRVLAVAPLRSRTFRKRLRRGAAISTRGRVRSPELVVDLGTGSGILALAARLLGAKQVIGIDNDPTAISTATQNARRNKVDAVDFKVADVRSWKLPRNSQLRGRGYGGQVDIITANLFSELLTSILPKLNRARWLILSGILREQERDLTRALKRHNIGIVDVRRRGIWVAILAQRAGR